MRAYEFLTEGRDAPLYHGINKIEHAITALKNNRLAATTTQRFWPDGKRRVQQSPNDQEYENSYWMKGLSLTRDKDMAFGWGNVVFILDQTKLAQRYKFVPLNWMYSIKNSISRKKEREEFLVVKSTPDTYHDQVDEDDPDFKPFNVNRFTSVEGYVENLNKYLLGIYVSDNFDNNYFSIELTEEERNLIFKHPKFLGIYDSNHHSGRLSKSQVKIKENMITEAPQIFKNNDYKIYINPTRTYFEQILLNAVTYDLQKFYTKYGINKNLDLTDEVQEDEFWNQMAMTGGCVHDLDSVLRGCISDKGKIFIWDAYDADHYEVMEFLQNEYGENITIPLTISRDKSVGCPSKYTNNVKQNNVISKWNFPINNKGYDF
jgi:hypothetical protein